MWRTLLSFGNQLPPPLSWLSRLASKSPVTALIICMLAGGAYYAESNQREAMSWQGVPAATTFYHPGTFFRVLRNQDFLIGWSDLRMTPLWVEYKLHIRSNYNHLPRLEGFSSDWRSGLPLTSSAYDGSGYDRGHMAPNYAIASVYGMQGQRDTFKMTNVAPQRPNLNRKLWQRLESSVMDHMLPRMGTLWVITGPIYEGSPKWLPSCQRAMFHLTKLPVCVSIPTAFYKIIVAPGGNGVLPKVLAFIMPQDVVGNEPLNRYLVTVKEVERQTGLAFFGHMSPVEQADLKNQIRTAGWGISSWATLPSRY
ncbi:hypothetical protein LMG33818_001330 [Halomonadaceae bacterium LMG 33818]|uniref:DNA/RNA non-specific endonuclease n=1 Tax=Cernens ardua TaxID=3402176 RepID=UPI003EDB8EE8